MDSARPPKTSSSGHFLFFKTHTPDDIQKPVERPCILTVAAGAVMDGLPSGDAFREKLLACVEDKPVFCVLGLRLLCDPSQDPPQPERVEKMAAALARACLETSEACSGLVGAIDAGTLGWVLPDLCLEEARRPLHRVKELLPDAVSRALTVGMAAFPLLDFAREDMADNARKAADHAAMLGPGAEVLLDAVTLNVSGDRFFEANDMAGAIAEYERGLVLDPVNENLLNSLGVCHGILGNLDAAMTCFEKVLEKEPSDPMAIYNTGYLHLLKGNRDVAIAHFLRACNLDPNIFEVAFQTGKTYLAMGHPENAEPFLQRAASLKPQSNPALRLLGECLEALGKEKEAETAFREAIRIAPVDAESLSALGRLYERKNRNLDIAAVFHQQSITIAPGNGRYHLRLGRVLLKLGRLKEALTACREAEALGHPAQELVSLISERIETRRSAGQNPAS